MLSCNIKGVTNGFPLRLEIEKFVEKEVDFSAEFLRNIFPKSEWKALVNATRSMGYAQLPDEVDSPMLDSEDFLKKFHHTLLELHLEEGFLICPETGRRFPINKGILNSLHRAVLARGPRRTVPSSPVETLGVGPAWPTAQASGLVPCSAGTVAWAVPGCRPCPGLGPCQAEL
uniref:Multifunctional methyltransferase subunit TRM112-like protein At1g22270 n=1 Tax=Nelumbo nucifera TaxID=4432 RepID=A0A822YDR4_NELNU|nr:TPA_asm: hypothetical protein HUJ06_009353 [Nelumbo nucifera]